jgi:thiamine biosynthesis protein ThiS
MRFELNGEYRQLSSAPLSVYQLIINEGLLKSETKEPRLGIAVAINQQIVPRSQWQGRYIQPDDQVDLFQAIAGG